MSLTDNHLSKTSAASLPTPSAVQSMCAWLFVKTSFSTTQSMLGHYNAASTSAIQIGARGGQLAVWSWGGTILIQTSTAPTLNTWNHIAWTYNATTHILYINGVQVASGSATTQTATSNQLYINGYPTGT